jgi:hypothetical protein
MDPLNPWEGIHSLDHSARESLLDLTIRLWSIGGVESNHFQGMDSSYRLRQAFWSAIRFYFREDCPAELGNHFIELFQKLPRSMQRAIVIYDVPRLEKFKGRWIVAAFLVNVFLRTSGVSEEDNARCRVSLWKLCNDLVVFKGIDFASDEVAERLANYIGFEQLFETLRQRGDWKDFLCLRPYGIVLALKTVKDLETHGRELLELFNESPRALKLAQKMWPAERIPAETHAKDHIFSVLKDPKDMYKRIGPQRAVRLDHLEPADWEQMTNTRASDYVKGLSPLPRVDNGKEDQPASPE